MSDTQTAAANWYPDPAGSPQLRWWDGTQWTNMYAPPATPAKAKLSGVALAGFICSAVAFIASYGPTQVIVLAVAGIIMSGVAIPQTKRGYRGYGFAITGVILGALSAAIIIGASILRATLL
jgi:hypothetical protein